MSRWHDKSCLQPQIEVEDGTPKCLACHQRPHLDELAAAGAATNISPPIPPDKPLGELNLWWPPSVPYERPSTRVEETTGNTHESGPCPSPTAAKMEAEDPPISSSSVVYEKTIQSDQIRLIYLAAVEDDDSPVHVILEVYDLENCPEYEAVSYTWGGENGDNVRSCPVYIGSFWDVLFQTKNCWEMLRFMRPPRDARTFWVDAICIDQINVLERNAQVANMGRIYSQCSRVVLYLGPDMAVPLSGRHPRRHRLHELETGSVVPKFAETHEPRHRITLRTTLKRRYFTRAWVIQELVLPINVTMRIGDVDFWADANTPTLLASEAPDWTWERTEAPWAQLSTQGALVTKDLWELLGMASKGQATDNRDRVFALLGILPRQDPSSHDRSLKPDYSLSAQEVLIGTFAYFLTNSPGRPQFLTRASGLGAPSGYPSWLPDWRSVCSETWSQLMTEYDKWTWLDAMDNLKACRRSPESESMHWLSDDSFRFFDYEDYDNKAGRRVWKRTRLRPWTWPSDVRVETTTGGLKVKLRLFLIINKVPSCASKMGDHGWFSYRIDGHGVVDMFSRHPLDTMVVAGLDRLFILDDDGLAHPMYLILRPVAGRRGSYTLVATCPYICFELDSGKESLRWLKSRSIHFRIVSSDLFAHLSSMQAYLKKLTSADIAPEMRRFFPHAKSQRELLHLAVAHFLTKKPSTSAGAFSTKQFEEVYLSCVNSGENGLEARLDDGLLMLRFHLEGDAWKLRQQKIHRLYNPRARDPDDGPVWLTTLSKAEGRNRWLEARCQFSSLVDVLENTSESSKDDFEDRLLFLYAASVESDEELLSLWSREPKAADKDIPCNAWYEPMTFECREVLQNLGFMGGGLMTVKIV